MKEQAARVGASRRGTWLAVGAAAIVLAAAAVVLVLMSRGGGDGDRNAEPAVVPDRDQRRDDAPDPIDEKTWSKRFQSPEQRRALERALEQARVRRGAAGGPGDLVERKDGRPVGKPKKGVPGGGDGDSDSDKVGTLDKEYIRSVVRDALPLLRECYELALASNPTLAGRLQVEFTIAGEPDVGGLVESAETSKEGIGANEEMSECVRETMMSLEFPAPEGGGRVEVRYPFVFSPEGEPPPDPPAKDEPPAPPVATKRKTDKKPAPAVSPKKIPLEEPEDSGDDDADEDDADGSDAPTDKPAKPLSTKDGPAELTAKAKEAAKAGQWAKALQLCESAASMAPADEENAVVCVMAACKIKNVAKAKKHFARLRSEGRKGMAHQVCLREGIDVAAK
jgi:hypothetical protein